MFAAVRFKILIMLPRYVASIGLVLDDTYSTSIGKHCVKHPSNAHLFGTSTP